MATFAVWFLGNYEEIINNIKNRTKKISSEKVRRYLFDVEIVLLLIISFISVGVSGFSNNAFGIWKAYFFEPLLFYIILFNVFGAKKEGEENSFSLIFSQIIWSLTIASFLISVFAVYQKFTGNFIANPFWSAETTRRVVSVFSYPNALGLYLAPLVLLMIGKLLSALSVYILPRPAGEGWGEGASRKKIIKIILLLTTIILSLLSIQFAHSEGAIVGISAGLIMFGLLFGKKTRLATLGFLAIAFIVIFANINLRDKFIEKATLSDFSGEVRKQQWRETWKVLTESPQRFILGAGLDNYQKAVKPYHQEGIFFNKDNDPDFRRKLVLFNNEYKMKYWQPVEIYMYPHNIFLNFWSELGLAGALLFVWIIAKFYYIGFRQLFQNSKLKIKNSGSNAKESYLIIALLCTMTAIVVHGAVDVPYFKNDLSVMFWVIIALMGMSNLINNKEIK